MLLNNDGLSGSTVIESAVLRDSVEKTDGGSKRMRFCPLKFSGTLAAIMLSLTVGSSAEGQQIPITEVERATPVSFEKEILPLLRANCLACHSQTEKQGELVLESPQTMRRGGDNGPALIPGNPDESLLLKLASHADEPVMPPQDNDVAAKNLTSAQLGLLKLWISQGAQGTGSTTVLSPGSWQPLPKGIHPVLATALSPDGQFVACTRSNHVCLYHVASGQLVTQMIDPAIETGGAHRDLVQSLTFNAEGDLLASGGFREVKLWRRPRDIQKQTIAVGAPIRSVCVSPDRLLVAMNGPDNTVQLRNVADGAVTRTLTGHTAEVTGIRFSSDGSQLLTSSLDQTVRIWDLATGDVAASIQVPSPVNAVELVLLQAPTEQEPHPPFHIVTAGADNIIRVWAPGEVEPAEEADTEKVDDAEKEPEAAFKQVVEIKSHSKPVTCLSAVPGRPQEVVSGSLDSTMRWWRTSNGQQVRQFNHGGPVLAVDAAADGAAFASGGENNSAKLWRNNGQQIAELKGDLRRNAAVARAKQQLSSAGSRVNVAKRQLDEAEKDLPKKTNAEKTIAEALQKANKDVEEKSVALKKASDEKTKAEVAAVAAAVDVRSAQVALDVAQASVDRAAANVKALQDRAAKLQLAVNASPANEELKKLLADSQAAVQQGQQEAQQKTAAMKEPTSQLQTATSKANQAAQEINKVQKPYTDALLALRQSEQVQNLTSQQYALAKTELAAATELIPVRKKALEQAEAAQAAAQETVTKAEEAAKAAEQPVHALRFSPDGKALLTGGAFKVLHSWDSATGAAIASWSGSEGSISSVAWADSDSIISASDDQSIRIWEVNPGWRLERTCGAVDKPEVISHRVTAVDFSHDSKWLLVGSGIPSRSGQVSVFNVVDGKQVLHLPAAHDDVVYSARFAPDASRFASAGADRYVRTFDAVTGKLLRRFEGHTNHVLRISWKSDGQTLASAAADNTVKVWDVETADQKRTVSSYKRHVTGLCFSGDTDDVFSVSGDGTVRLVRTTNGGTIRSFNGAEGWVHCASLSRDGRVAAAGDAAGSLYLWNTTNGQLLHRLTGADEQAE